VPELTSRLITGLAATATVWLAGDTLMRPTPAGGVVGVGAGVVTTGVAVLVAVLGATVAVLVAVLVETVAVLVTVLGGVVTVVVMVIVPPTADGVPILAYAASVND